MGNGDRRDLDIDVRDFNGTRTTSEDVLELGFGDWHQLVITYRDATDDITPDGEMNFYLNGDTNAVVVFTGLEQYHEGSAVEPDQSILNYAEIFFNNFTELGRNMNGDLAILRLYNVILTPEQIVQNWDAQKNLYPFPQPPSTIVPISQTDLVEVQVDTVNGTIYELERTTSPLVDDSWQSVEVFIKGNGSAMRMYDNRDPAGPQYNRVSVSTP